jgi:hypothetical protein
MKVFLSWSGDLSHKVACVLREWIPSVIQAVVPYVSSEDIDKGTRWSSDIANELAESSYGIICVTKENLLAPWVHFEAGALSKSIDKSNVTPFLFDVKRSEVGGPLLQFQSTVFEKDDMTKLLKSLNGRLKEGEQLRDAALLRAIDVWWPQLDSTLKELPKPAPAAPTSSEKPGGHRSDILEELLELARNQQRALARPETLLPAEYLYRVFERMNLKGSDDERRSVIVNKLHADIMDIERMAEEVARELPERHDRLTELVNQITKLHSNFHQLAEDPLHLPASARSDYGVRKHLTKTSLVAGRP